MSVNGKITNNTKLRRGGGRAGGATVLVLAAEAGTGAGLPFGNGGLGSAGFFLSLLINHASSCSFAIAEKRT